MEVFALANDRLLVPGKKEMIRKVKEIPRKSTRRKWIIAVLGLILPATFYVIYPVFFHKVSFSGEKTIAVLPFENNGRDGRDDKC